MIKERKTKGPKETVVCSLTCHEGPQITSQGGKGKTEKPGTQETRGFPATDVGP